MPDLALEIEGNEFSLEAVTDNGLEWLIHDAEAVCGQGIFRVPQIGERIFFPLNVQDMITHEIQDQGLVISS